MSKQKVAAITGASRGIGAFGRIDTLINNAGAFVAKPFIDYTDADYDLAIGVNMRGFLEVSKQAIAAILAHPAPDL